MQIHDIHQLVINEIGKMHGDKKMGDDYIMVCCPFHDDSKPSCGIYTALGMEVPLGFFHCLGCGAKGGWNALAKQAGLQQVKDWELRDASKLSIGNVEKQFKVNKVYTNVDSLMRDLNRTAYIEWPEDVSWRGYNGKLVQDCGGLMLMQGNANFPVCFFPVKQTDKRIVGGVAAYLKKQINGLSYVNTEGTWTKETGLFQLSLTKKLMSHHNLNYVMVCEGPRDFMAMICEGVPTVSALGANNFSPQKLQKLIYAGAQTIYSLVDNDKGGDKLRASIAYECKQAGVRHLPIKLPKKLEIDGEMQKVKLDPDNLPIDLMDEVLDYIEGNNHKLVNVKKHYGWMKQQ